ncbi:hypothetical protein PGT21_003485 [Puccinia graminis f. sp. tritici]|uniref:Uncharacterized protein n=1 Tax=Puccinia graminis f. sp. tritici TaxID=56615 RepID=A0A5B0PMW8_PUCGR|nr:hypothetical protein PGT21_003485 [Puccinia graminis f. sp. tritici]
MCSTSLVSFTDRFPSEPPPSSLHSRQASSCSNSIYAGSDSRSLAPKDEQGETIARSSGSPNKLKSSTIPPHSRRPSQGLSPESQTKPKFNPRPDLAKSEARKDRPTSQTILKNTQISSRTYWA